MFQYWLSLIAFRVPLGTTIVYLAPANAAEHGDTIAPTMAA